jgi:hypothetical protein
MSLIMKFYERMKQSTEKGIPLQRTLEIPAKNEIARAKIQPSETFKEFANGLSARIDEQFHELSREIVEAAK